jgi:Na+/proline symporter
MQTADWIVLVSTIGVLVLYGLYKGRSQKDIHSYLLAGKELPWYHVLLSVMATQASAITFLSVPGQAYTDGMRFLQFYFGLPLAMIVLCITFVPIFHKLKVFTAYEFLETRFDLKTRQLTSFLFLLQRGLSTGLSIYAPGIILSVILKVPVQYTTLAIGVLVIVYTVYGGTKAVSYTQLLQMIIIFSGLILAGYYSLKLLPQNIGIGTALHLAGDAGKMNLINFEFDWRDRYNIWSGIIGGFFLQLSYFGTDQSQVGRYLTAHSIKQSRMGLIINGMLKIPMQFFILLLGVLVYVFYLFNQPPLLFNESEILRNNKNVLTDTTYLQLKQEYETAHYLKTQAAADLANAYNNRQQVEEKKETFRALTATSDSIRKKAKDFLSSKKVTEQNDGNYIFLTFVIKHLPTGLVGLLIAIIFLASMGSLASGLNSLAASTVVDFYRRNHKNQSVPKHYLRASRISTLAWGLFCIAAALFASKLGNLVEAVNVLGSLFYGTILGIFLVAFYVKKIKGNAVLIPAIITELFVIVCWYFDVMAFLWLNVLGCVMVMGLSYLNMVLKGNK